MAGMKRCGFGVEGLTTAGRSNHNRSKSLRLGMKKRSEGLMTFGRSLRSGVTRAMFPEDLEVSEKKIFDPQDKSLLFWNKLLLISCIIAVSIDPLFFYLPIFKSEDMCLHIDESLAYTITTLRTVVDIFYIIRIFLQFRTAYIAPSSRVFGRGELVIDPADIASRYLHRFFIVDLISVLPLPQILVWRFLHRSKGATVFATKQDLLRIVIIQYFFRFWRVLPLTSELKKSAGVFAETAWAGAAFYLSWFMLASHILVWRFLHRSKGATVFATKQDLLRIVIIQYFFRFWRVLPLTSELKKSAGVFAETAWAGAAFYLSWFMLASHIIGALWYLLAVERKDACWEKACNDNPGNCSVNDLYCGEKDINYLKAWKNFSQAVINPRCSINEEDPQFNYGIFEAALSSGLVESEDFVSKFFYCLWWGLQNLSTLGQGLLTSTYPGEVIFSMLVAILGLVLFALLIGNMQTYLQSLTLRLEEMRIKRRDSEQWMHHRLLPQELRERVRRYNQYKWLETRGVDEESLVQNLPKDLRRDIKRHLCLNLVRRVPLFANMDERLLDAICERLKPSLYTESTYIVREGDPVDEMLFVIRGRMESVTTDGGRSGFFNLGFLKEGDFCGEELLTWALDPKSGANLPPSTRTVKALTEVEAFALIADEVKFIASQFRRLHSRQVQHTFRFYSQQWRTWAAIFIQAAWRRYSRRKVVELNRNEEAVEEEDEESALIRSNTSRLGATMLVSRFAANALRGVHRFRSSRSSGSFTKPQRPPEPDFAED
ncbi:unnamed protein product [Ilex paraguariensis]|uniref:Cyclic nucleotide-binding domain-containing protein n=1 Tax=Ilex paraguariensis TaxID=185542 RepID=A0ABC8V0N3_9AQUA